MSSSWYFFRCGNPPTVADLPLLSKMPGELLKAMAISDPKSTKSAPEFDLSLYLIVSPYGSRNLGSETDSDI